MTDYFYKHIKASDIKTEIEVANGQFKGVLLSKSELNFALLFYTLAAWERQEEQAAKQEIPAFVKIPRVDHVKDVGTSLIESPEPTFKKKNVDGFVKTARYLADKYKAYLSPDQYQQLQLESVDHVPTFSTSLLFLDSNHGEHSGYFLNVHYRGGNDMYREKAFEKTANSDSKQWGAILDATAAYNDMRAKARSELREMQSLIETERTKILLRSQNKVDALIKKRQECSDEWQKKILALLESITKLKAAAAPGGAIAAGGMGIGRLEQQIAVDLPLSPTNMVDINFATAERLFVRQSPFEMVASASFVQKPYLHLAGIAFRKPSRHPESDFFKKTGRAIQIGVDGYLNETRELFRNEALIAEESGWMSIYEVNPSTEKPEIHSTFCMGRSLFSLMPDPNLNFKERVILLDLVIKEYARFRQDPKSSAIFYHGDLKEENILIERLDGTLQVKFIDRAFTLKSDDSQPIQRTRTASTLQGDKSVPDPLRTSGYAAPEVKDYAIYSTDSDIYALGCILENILLPVKITSLSKQESVVLSELKKLSAQMMIENIEHKKNDRDKKPRRFELKEIDAVFKKVLTQCGISNPEEQGLLFTELLPDKTNAAYKPKL